MGLRGVEASDAAAVPQPDYRALYLRAQRRFERERAVRLEVEAIAERGLRDLHERERQQALLEAVARHANGTSSEEDALGFALAEVCGHAGWVFGCVYRPVASDPSTLAPSSITHIAGDGLDLFAAATERAAFPPKIGLPGRVRASRRAHWVADVTADDNFQRAAAAAACGLRAGVAFPISVAGEVVAVVEFFAREALPSNAAFLGVLTEIGTQLGRVVERARAARRLIYDATHDALTGLPNRTLFLDRLDAALLRGTVSAVLFIDLDRFKLVNDSLGHAAGDALLVTIASRFAAVTAAAGASHVLARLGGDEFTVLLDGVADAAAASAFAGRLLAALQEPIEVGGTKLHATASVGIVTKSFGRDRARDLMRDADLAMYRAKAAGRARVAVFDDSLHREAVRRLDLENDLRTAVRDGLFVLHFQPIVSLADRRTLGFEALVRWQRTPDALVHPGGFIEIAEETGLIMPLGFWVMAQACLAAVRWNAAHSTQARRWVSVNVSPRQFRCEDFVDRVRAILSQVGAEPGLLKIEITESVAMENTERAVSVLSSLRDLGVGISIDDFGTGYSSLSSLHRLPFDTLKIDRSFVGALGRDGDGAEIVRTVLSLARSLGLRVVAEGAETEAQVEALAAMGCDQAQGFHFSRPVPESAAVGMIAAEAGYRGSTHDILPLSPRDLRGAASVDQRSPAQPAVSGRRRGAARGR